MYVGGHNIYKKRLGNSPFSMEANTINNLIYIIYLLSIYFDYSFFLSFISVSCNNLIIAIGLCIDYASHIAHRFLIEPGPDRNSRIRSTVENIGPVGYGVSNLRLHN